MFRKKNFFFALKRDNSSALFIASCNYNPIGILDRLCSILLRSTFSLDQSVHTNHTSHFERRGSERDSASSSL